jgi:hypothetical protein
MHQSIMLTGLVLLGLGAMAPRAIALETSAASRSMADVDLPSLGTTIVNRPTVAAPSVADVLPDTGFVDLMPTHWAYGAVNRLTQNYGCLAGYPDGTFRGDEFVTRYEFAAAMDVCLGNLLQLTELPTSDASLDDILADLAELQDELGRLDTDVDAIAPGQPHD